MPKVGSTNELSEAAPLVSPTRQGDEPLARIQVCVGISIIIPTYREVENIPLILNRIDQLRRGYDLDIEVLFMDDDSRDGSIEAVERAGHPWARIVVRRENRGLSPAVVDGFNLAQMPILVCMDCDLSHPPEKIPAMVLALESGQQLVLGSRYVPGGSTDDDWGVFRWLNSRIATLLARPLTKAHDPMSGFMAMRRSDFLKARDLNPIGYKIALELIVKCNCENVGEVPIRFNDRQFGESKLTLREQFRYIQHLRRLYIYKFGTAMHLIQFLVVGASGVAVNMLVISLLLALGSSNSISLAGGIAVSVVTNFLLNRRFSFSYARNGKPWRQFAGFVGSSSVGIIVNYSVALYMTSHFSDDQTYSLHIAALVGIIAGMGFNFIGNRYFVFRKRFVRE